MQSTESSRLSIFSAIAGMRSICHRAHDGITLVALGLVVWSITSHIDFSALRAHIHIDWKIIAGVSLLVLANGIGFLTRVALRVIDTMTIAAPDPELSGFRMANMSYAPMNDADISTLVTLFDRAYPHGFLTRIINQRKRLTFECWRRVNPEFARLIWERNLEGKCVPIGFTIVLRVTKEAYCRYRNGNGIPWYWNAADVVSYGEPGTPYIFAQAFYCPKRRDPNARKFFTKAILSHLGVASISAPPVIINPKPTRNSEINITQLGFAQCSTSEAGFGLFELDARRRDELPLSAIATIDALHALSSHTTCDMAEQSVPPEPRAARVLKSMSFAAAR